MKSGYNGISFNSIFKRVNNKPFIVEISSRNGMKLVLIVPILSRSVVKLFREDRYIRSRVSSTIIQRIWIVSFRFVSCFSTTNLVLFCFRVFVFDIWYIGILKFFFFVLFYVFLIEFLRLYLYIYIVEKFVRFITFLFKDEPVPAVLLLAFRFAVKKFLDFLFFLYFFLFRRCFSRRRKILNLFSCFLSLYFTRIFYRLSFSLHFLSLSKNFQIFSLHRTFLSSSLISSSSKRILVLVTINYWKIFSFFFFFS